MCKWSPHCQVRRLNIPECFISGCKLKPRHFRRQKRNFKQSTSNSAGNRNLCSSINKCEQLAVRFQITRWNWVAKLELILIFFSLTTMRRNRPFQLEWQLIIKPDMVQKRCIICELETLSKLSVPDVRTLVRTKETCPIDWVNKTRKI